MTKIDNIDNIKSGQETRKNNYPSCFGNYCPNHEACSDCTYKKECKEIKNPKEPGWCQ